MWTETYKSPRFIILILTPLRHHKFLCVFSIFLLISDCARALKSYVPPLWDRWLTEWLSECSVSAPMSENSDLVLAVLWHPQMERKSAVCSSLPELESVCFHLSGLWHFSCTPQYMLIWPLLLNTSASTPSDSEPSACFRLLLLLTTQSPTLHLVAFKDTESCPQ